jgi:hypothetical protein
VDNERVGVVVTDRSSAAVTDATIWDNHEGGLSVQSRSDVSVTGTTFAETGGVHVSATDFGSVTLRSGVKVGSIFDDTGFALSVNRDSVITSNSTTVLYGSVGTLVGGAVRLANATVTGNLLVFQFSNAHLRTAQVVGSVVCREGGDAICLQTTTGGSLGCTSTTCGAPPPSGRALELLELPEIPVIEVPPFELPPQRSTTSAAGSRRL